MDENTGVTAVPELTNFEEGQRVTFDHGKILALPHGSLIQRSFQKKFGDKPVFGVVKKETASEKVAEQSGHPEIIHVEVLTAENFVGQTTSFTGALLSPITL